MSPMRPTQRRFAADWTPLAQRLTAAFWPGPLTVIVERRAGMGAAAAGGQDSIGLRCPAHPVAQALAARRGRQRGQRGCRTQRQPVRPHQPDHRCTRRRRIRRRSADARWRAVPGRHRIEHRRLPGCRTGAAAPGHVVERADRGGGRRGVGRPQPTRRCASRAALESHYAPRATLRLMDAAQLKAALQVLGPAFPGLAVYSHSIAAGSATAGRFALAHACRRRPGLWRTNCFRCCVSSTRQACN